MADINTIVADPKFRSLPAADQKYILSQLSGQTQEVKQTPQPIDLADATTLQGSWDRKDADTIIDIARPVVAGAAAAGTGAYTGPGAFAAAPAAYGTVDYLMQKLKSKESKGILASGLDLNDGSVPANVANTVEQWGLGKIIGGLFKVPGAIRNSGQPEIFNFKPTTSQALKATGHNFLGTGAKALEDLSLTAKEKALDRTAGAGFTEALKLSKQVGFQRLDNGRINFTLNPQRSLENVAKLGQVVDPEGFQTFGAVDKVIANPKLLESTLTAAQSNGVGENLKRTLQSYQFQKIYNAAAERSLSGTKATNNVVRMNPDTIDKMWLDPKMQDSLGKLYTSKQRADISQFFKNVQATQDKIQSNPIAKKLFVLHGGVGIATGLLTGNVAAAPIASMSTFIAAEGVGRLLTNTKTARLMVRLAGGEALGMSDEFAGKLLSQVLTGSTVALMDAEGNKTPVKVENGKFVPLELPQ
jgi:hypothetical protein